MNDQARRPGETIGDEYVLGDVLGSGGMGIVYGATQPRLGRTVAVKMLRPELASNANMIARFRNEALAGSRLSHPHIVGIIDFATTSDGALYLVMKHVRGQRLGQLVREGARVALSQAAQIVGQILAALDETHAAGIVHADVKSDNFLVEALRDGTDLVTLIDFGLARFAGAHDISTPQPMFSGTPEYLAPEVIRGAPPSPASDLYGAGAILYELLTGTTPFAGGSSEEVLARQLNEDVVPPSLRCLERELPLELERVVLRALEKSPDDRFASAAAFAHALAVAAAACERSERVGSASASAVPQFSTEAQTGVWASPARAIRPGRIGAGTGPSAALGELPALRRGIADAIGAGNVDAIAAAYLELARHLVDDHELRAAASELEDAIAYLAASASPSRGGPLWRVTLAVAALYDGIGDRMHARRAAHSALEHAIRADSGTGQDRAHALLRRLAPSVTRAR